MKISLFVKKGIVLVRVSMVVNRYQDQATLIRKAFNWVDLLTISKVQSIIIMVGSMAVCRQTWC